VTVGLASSEVSFGYDGDGLLTRAAAVPAGWVFDIHRADSTGLVDSTQVGAGAGRVTSSAGYNAHGELAELHYSLAGVALFHQSIERNVLGQITRITESWQGGAPTVRAYGYNLAGRLDSVAVDGTVTQALEYDRDQPGNGNRTRFGPAVGDTASYDFQDRLQIYGTAAYAYTANGELARKVVAGTDTTRYSYDALGNLTGAHLPGVAGDSLVYVIDGQNRRVAVKRNGITERQWLYANGIAPIAELDGAGALVNRYVYATLGHAPDLVLHADTAYRVVTDQLGSVRAVVRTTDGAIVQRTDYDAWGVITADAGGTFQSLGYAGGLTDRTTALVRFGARDYEPATGRWTAKDPIRFRGGLNAYGYVGNAPMETIDPSGFGQSGRGSHNYDCQQTKEILQWVREDATGWDGSYHATRNHAFPGLLDFANREPGAVFHVPGVNQPMSADQFGNFIAGYAGYYQGRRFGYAMVIAGGWLFDLFGDIEAERPFNNDEDSRSDIGLGYAYAQSENSNASGCGCP